MWILVPLRKGQLLVPSTKKSGSNLPYIQPGLEYTRVSLLQTLWSACPSCCGNVHSTKAKCDDCTWPWGVKYWSQKQTWLKLDRNELWLSTQTKYPVETSVAIWRNETKLPVPEAKQEWILYILQANDVVELQHPNQPDQCIQFRVVQVNRKRRREPNTSTEGDENAKQSKDDTDKDKAKDEQEELKPKEPEVQKEDARFKLFFVRKGSDMTKHLLDGDSGLQAHVLSRGNCTIVENPREATHWIVSDRPVAPTSIPEACGFASVEECQAFVKKQSIVLVKRAWAARGNRLQKPPLKEPTMMEQQTMAFVRATSLGSSSSNPKKSPSTSRSMNNQIAEHFQQLSKLYQKAPLQEQDTWRAYTFSIAAGRLRHLPFVVSLDTLDQLKQTQGFGPTSIAIVCDFLQGHHTGRMEALLRDPHRVAMKELMSIWGVGRKRAHELYAGNLRSVHQVRQACHEGKVLLDRNQFIGVLCHEDIMERMPRSEAEAIFAWVEEEFQKQLPGAEVEVMGSYRRGATTCGDVDILVTHPHFVTSIPGGELGKVVDSLTEQGRIAYHLTRAKGMRSSTFETLPAHIAKGLKKPPEYGRKDKYSHMPCVTWMGVFNSPTIPGKRRRVDIKMYPYRERVFARIYFTGNGFFNRSMRLWATRKHAWTLNDHGLWQWHTTKSVLTAPRTEKQVFDKLGIIWKEVNERDGFDAVIGKENGETAFSLRELSRSALRQETEEHKWIDWRACAMHSEKSSTHTS